MKPSIAAALLCLGLAPLAAPAQVAEAPPVAATAPAAALPAAPAAEPVGPWSLGAGVGYVVYGNTVGLARLGPSSVLLYAPSVQASLERALAPGWWLVFGAAGSATRARGEAPAGSYLSTRNDDSWAGASVGVRRALTRAGAPVTVSMHLLANASYAWSRQDLQSPTPETRTGEAWGLGLTAGLAVERELTSGLSLRAATPLLAVGWNRAALDSSTSGHASSDGGGVSLVLAPSLELRLAF